MSVSSVKNLNGVTFSAVQDYSLTDFIQTNSGSWGGGSVDTIPVVAISPLVTGFSGESAYLGIESTALNLSSYVPVSSIGYNGSYISTISGKSISSYTGRYAMTANYANTADRAYKDRNSNEITSYYQPKLTIAGENGTITAINSSAVGASIPAGWELVAGAGISIVDDSENNQTIISATGGGGNPEVEQVVQTYSAAGTWLINSDLNGYLTTGQYETDSAVFNAKQDALTFSTADTLSAASNYGYRPTTGISGIGGSALIIPMAVIQYWNSKTLNYASAINQIYKDRIAADLDGQGNYIKDTYQKISGVSATEWNSNYDTVNTNSGAWGGQSLPISAGAGIKVNLVDNTLVFSNDYNKVVIDEIITAGYYRDGNSIYPILQKTVNVAFNATTAYNNNNVILNGSTTPWSGASIKWLDVGNSFMNYGGQARLATNYQLDANRIGNVVLLAGGSLSYRGKDTNSSPITGTFTIKWVEQ